MERKEIKFYEDTLLGVKDDEGKVWLAVRKTCRDIGLTDGQAKRQVENLNSDIVFREGVANLLHLSSGGEQKTLCIMEKFVTLWLAKISLTPAMQKKNPDAVQKLLRYQLEAADVLHKAFYETEEQKSTFHERMGLEGEIAELKEVVGAMEKKLDSVMDNMTLTTVQQGRLQRAVKDRIRVLLGGAHSREYKENSRLYFINFWNDIKEKFNCGSRWQDLNPCYFKEAFAFISNWSYSE